MIFIGQKHIMKQLRFLLPELYHNRDIGRNFLIRGPSGYGKTTLAISMCKYLTGSSFQVYWADWTEFNFRKRVIFIDEIHRMKDHERLFGVMDSRKHILIFATNQDANLPEAFVNRCTHFIFSDYTMEELMLIAKDSLSVEVSDESLESIVVAGNHNPRIIKDELCDKLNIYFKTYREIDPLNVDMDSVLKEVFSIEGGLNTLCRKYLETLNDVGGTASLFLLKSILHIDDVTIKSEVEPVLLKKGLIKITSKGRTLNDTSKK